MISVKTIAKFISLLVIIFITGCETERIIFEGPYHVRFTESTASSRESFSKPIKIAVHIAAPAPDKDVTVRYTIAGDAREGVDYEILSDREIVVIKKGEYFGYIEVQLINNANNIIRSQSIVFNIVSADDNLQIGDGKAGIGKAFTFTIFDDCILGGNYKGFQSAFDIPIEGIKITSEDCETYTLSNWNINFLNTSFDIPLTFIDNNDNTLTIPTQKQDSYGFDFSGIGTVNPVTRQIEFTINIDEEDVPPLVFTLIPD